jgi:CRP/FNR family transcriptional regulator
MLQDVRSSIGELFAQPAVSAEGIEVARGATIYAQGSPAEHVYYIHHGQVRLYQIAPDGDERLVEILGPGQWFGCAALADKPAYLTQAVASTDAQLSRASAQTLLEHAATSPTAATQLIRQLANQVQSARQEAARLQFEDCQSRLVNAMLRFSDSAAATQQGDNVVLHMTHEQLAQAVGAARETISLALTEMRHLNVVRTGRNKLVFNRQALEALKQNGTGAVNGHASHEAPHSHEVAGQPEPQVA